MQLDSPKLSFPTAFCCNCGETPCQPQSQATRVSRLLGIGGPDTVFQLPVPVCARCRRSTGRRSPGLLLRLLVVMLAVGAFYLAAALIGSMLTLPVWMDSHLLLISGVLGVLLVTLVFRLRRPKPPMTSFYQPVRIKNVRVQVTDVMHGYGQVAYMKLAFTNPAYLALFAEANGAAIAAGSLAAVKA